MRLLTSIELFEKAPYYARYSLFIKQVETNNFPTLSGVLIACVSFECSDQFKLISNESVSEIIKMEALINCQTNKFSSFLCLIALSSVLNFPIRSIYPDFGLEKFKKLFNTIIYPFCSIKNQNQNILNILWCNTDIISVMQNNSNWSPNHFVPIIKKSRIISCKNNHLAIKSDAIYPFHFVDSNLLPSSPKTETNKKKLSGVSFPEECNSEKNVKVQSKINFKKDNLVIELPLEPSVDSIFKSNPISTESESNDLSLDSDSVDISLYKDSNSLYDVSTYLARGKLLTAGKDDAILLDMINKVFCPNSIFIFPLSSNTKRSFKSEWLGQFSWLAYSSKEDGAYCLPCTLLGASIPNKSSVLNLVFKPHQEWSNAVRDFKKHEKSCVLHERSMLSFNALLSRCNSKSNVIEVDLNKSRLKLISDNRKKLVPIVKTIIFLGRNDLAFRGHRDDSKYHPDVGESSTQKVGVGNFIELLNFRVDAGDQTLANHLSSSPKNATYISKTTQNLLIDSCGKAIEEVLIKKMKHSIFFSILCDEAVDCSNTEQMSLVLRYINSDNEICEDFLRFIECKTGTSGLSLSLNVLNTLQEFGLDIQNCRGQGYDGAGCMAGEYKGVASRIKALNHKAIFVHCASHRLSLVVAAACQVQKVKNLLGQVKDISYFFNLSPKRSNCLKKYLGPNQEKLIDTCRTRWIQKLRGLDIFFDNFIPVIHAIEEMGVNESKEYNSDTASKSSSFFKLMTDFSFIVSLVITKQLMDFFYAITVTLQTKSFDISQQILEITNLKNLLLEIKKKIDVYHTEWYTIALSLANSLDIQEVRPRLCNVQVYRDNHPSNTVSDYFKHSITSPLIEHLINELDNRFPEDGMFVYKGLAAVPLTVLSRIQIGKPWKSDFYEFLKFYSSDMPHFTSIHAELDLWELFWKNQSNIPSTVAGTLKAIDMRGFPNIRIAFIILGTIPITTCECERSISVIRRLKTYSRSNMVESRFNSLALMSIHQEIFPDVERVIDIFSMSGERRLDLAFI